MKTIEIKYFAFLREARGLPSESYSTSATTLLGLYEELAEMYSFTLPVHQIRAAVNNAFVDMSEPFRDGDEVVFIPPVAGG